MRKAFDKIQSEIGWHNVALLCHNTAFDGAILYWHYGILAGYYYDTLSMTRGLHNEVSRASLAIVAQLYGIGAKSETYLTPTKNLKTLPSDIAKGLGEGCIIDVDLTHAIFCKQYQVFPQRELDLIDLTLRMFIQPSFVINKEVAEKALAEEFAERTWLMCAAGVPEKSLTSNPKFAAELEKLGVDVPMKISKITGKETYAFSQTDEDFLDLLDHEDRRVVRLVAGRLAAKSTLFETRGRRLIDDGTEGHRLPVLLNYFGAKTGRWSGGNRCLVGDTTIIIQRDKEIMYSMLSALRNSDKVWDGSEFVTHDGLINQGEAEVISYDGITGTPDHEVWVEGEGKVRLDTAKAAGHTLKAGCLPGGLAPYKASVPSSKGSLREPEQQDVPSIWWSRPDFQIRYRLGHGRVGDSQFGITAIAPA